MLMTTPAEAITTHPQVTDAAAHPAGTKPQKMWIRKSREDVGIEAPLAHPKWKWGGVVPIGEEDKESHHEGKECHRL